MIDAEQHGQHGQGPFPETIAQAVRKAVEATLGPIWGEYMVCHAGGEADSPCACVVGIISFLGDFTWSLALLLPQETAPALAKRFAGFDIPFDSPDMGDVVGELANVLAGDVIAQLETRRIKAQMSLPTVTRGQRMETMLPKGLPFLHMSFVAEQTGQDIFRFLLAAAKPSNIR